MTPHLLRAARALVNASAAVDLCPRCVSLADAADRCHEKALRRALEALREAVREAERGCGAS